MLQAAACCEAGNRYVDVPGSGRDAAALNAVPVFPQPGYRGLREVGLGGRLSRASDSGLRPESDPAGAIPVSAELAPLAFDDGDGVAP